MAPRLTKTHSKEFLTTVFDTGRVEHKIKGSTAEQKLPSLQGGHLGHRMSSTNSTQFQ
uniref:Uncharacterized protein n=1 Tax=Arundo donax TaxID=35708 RepID=A0A0A8YNV6_ARUDO